MRTLLRIGAPLILPWWIVIPAITWFVYEIRIERDITRLEQKTAERISLANRVIEDSISQLWRDSRMVTRVAATQLGAAEQASGAAVLAAVMNDFMHAHPLYTQARLLDPQCRERIRFDRRGSTVQRIDETELQDKSDRYYCHETLAMRPGEAYLSPLDLNIERGQIVLPHEPTLRIGTRVFGPDAQVLGLIVLNYNASGILDAFRQSGGEQLALLNEDGYWLASANRDDTFGFALGHPERTFSRAQPGLWQILTDGEATRGRLQANEHLWLYRRLPALQVASVLNGPTWYIVGELDPEQINELIREQGSLHAFLGGLALLIVTALAGLLAQRDVRQARTAEALAATNVQLNESLARLESSLEDRVLSEKLASLGLLVAGVAHELNTPLGGAMLTSTQLEDELETLEKAYAAGLRQSDIKHHIERNREGLDLLRRNLERAGTLISRFKKLASDRATSERASFALRTVVDDILALIHSETKHSRIKVAVDVAGDITLDSYPGPLGQVLQNLVQNAFRHGFAPGATGTVSIAASVADGNVNITISDDGVGIPEGHQERIWDPFFTTARSTGGTGLGLHLCQQLAGSILGGQLELARSAPGEGTSMALTIPQVAPDHLVAAGDAG